jgi:hypothetical protein
MNKKPDAKNLVTLSLLNDCVLGKSGLYRGVEEFVYLEEYCEWRPAFYVFVPEFSFNCGKK